MKVLNQKHNIDDFFRQLHRAQESVLILDFDGTLAPFSTKRMEVKLYPGLEDLLQKLIDNSKIHVVVVSGRALEDLKQLLPHYKELEVWGSHGLERKTKDQLINREFIEPHLMKILQEAFEVCRQSKYFTDCCEPKPYGLALHWRGLDSIEQHTLKEFVFPRWEELIKNTILEIFAFDGGIELRPKGKNKSHAVKAILSEYPEEASIAYLGDDHTDEDAFRALGDRGLKVLVKGIPIKTLADIQIVPPEELTEFLERWLSAQRGSDGNT